MKILLSTWSGRLISVLFPVALIASFFFPTLAWAAKQRSTGGGDPGVREGDPLDTNDFGGGGGGGGGSDIHNQSASTSLFGPFFFDLDRFQILLIPELVDGSMVYRIVIIDNRSPGMGDITLEGTNAQ